LESARLLQINKSAAAMKLLTTACLLVLASMVTTTAGARTCWNVWPDDRCTHYQRLGKCSSDRQQMWFYCYKACHPKCNSAVTASTPGPAGVITWNPTSEPTWVPTWEPIATCRRQDVWSTEKCQSMSHKCRFSGNKELWRNCNKTCFCAPTSTTAATTAATTTPVTTTPATTTPAATTPATTAPATTTVAASRAGAIAQHTYAFYGDRNINSFFIIQTLQTELAAKQVIAKPQQ